ncbi:xyloglucan endotransglucosylase protein 7-like isoform X2 [Humulus lupulus]|uniref:xyloglucan endotransglucosylase protein 7-like isoform X2 n=1 Tax=Humulus lupulus TaxID=3486 RepID=UPI002B402D31|nr:xyloglucan endotransglucosylase protein 7-like isoform X2 [Humulus lupulus]
MKNSVVLLLLSLTLSSFVVVLGDDSLYKNLDVTWGEGRCNILNDGSLMAVTLDKVSGSGFESKNEFLFVKIEMQIKLVPGNSAGTVTAFYLSSKGDRHDEIDFEFLGNVSGDPYTLHTNVFCKGEGKREQQFRLWFDPTADFHTYSILWSPQHILFMVDGSAIREFKNLEGFGVPYPTNRAMKLYSSLWNADDWATRGGLVKTDWSKAPFKAYFKSFKAENGCSWSRGGSCKTIFSSFSNNHRLWDKLDHKDQQKMKQIQKDHMVYDYCTDYDRFPQGPPKECYYKNLY